jgi:murein DD-endopeptidase MepM/ murein hydrolase activator NlpD
MRKKILIVTMIAVLVMCFSPLSFATSTQDKLNSVSNQKKDVSSDMESLTTQLKAQQKSIDSLQKSIDAKSAQINSAQKNLNETKAKIEERKNGLEQRLRAMYKNGSIGYVDIILSSKNVSELVSNIEMVQEIFKSDQNTLSTLKEQKVEIETLQAKLTSEKKVLDEKQNKLTAKKAEMQTVKNKLQAKYNQLAAAETQLLKELSTASSPGKYSGGKFTWPTTSHIITSYFGHRSSPGGIGSTYHQGIDIGAGYGSPVYAAASGTVYFAGSNSGYGNLVIINHGGGLFTYYGHNSSISVSTGQKVSRGQVIAHVGSTGHSTGPHLHFGVVSNDHFVNPLNYFK